MRPSAHSLLQEVFHDRIHLVPPQTARRPGAGPAVASIYYSQPLLGSLGDSLHASTASVGLVTTLTQLGYALGILLLAPLGDRHDRRGIIAAKAAVLALALLACGLAPGLGALMAPGRRP